MNADDLYDWRTATTTSETATPQLRYVRRNGERVLQQCFSIIEYRGTEPMSHALEWRDVPEVSEQLRTHPWS